MAIYNMKAENENGENTINDLEEMFDSQPEKIAKILRKPNTGLRKTKRVNSKYVKNKTRRFSRNFNRSHQL